MTPIESTTERSPSGRRQLGLSGVVILSALFGTAGVLCAQTPDDVAKANNPLAPITAINFQNYFVPSIYGLDDPKANSLLLRPVFATERFIFRGTLPVSTTPTDRPDPVSGLGDFSAFLAILLPSAGGWQLGIGPLVAIPTATDDGLVQVSGSWEWRVWR